MKIEIDQSGKVEYTKKHTVVADSLANALFISGKEKRQILKVFRLMGKNQIFVFNTFAVLLSILITKTFTKTNQYIVDIEYPGNMRRIKGLCLKILPKMGKPIQRDQLKFKLIGKASPAHRFAYLAYTKKRKAKVSKISAKTILSLLFKP